MGGLSDEVFVFGETADTRSPTVDQRAELLAKAYGEREPLPVSPAVEDWPSMTLPCEKCAGDGQCRRCEKRGRWGAFFPWCRHCDGDGQCRDCDGTGRLPNPRWYDPRLGI